MQGPARIATLTIGILLVACGGGGSSGTSTGSTGNTGGTGGNGGTGTTGSVPAIASIYPTSITAGAYDTYVYVDGSNFTASSIVNSNGSARHTEYISGTLLQVTLSAADIAPGSKVSLTVSNSSGTSDPVAVGISTADYSVRRIALNPPSDLLWDSAHQVIYVVQGGQLTVIDPVTATIRAAPQTGLSPDRMAISDDDQFLYVYQIGGALQRLKLPDLTLDATIPLLAPPNDVEVAPGAPRTIAVIGGGVAIYDDTSPRANRVTQDAPVEIVWGADASALYGRGRTSGGDTFFRMAVDASGVAITGTQQNPAIADLQTPPTGIVFDRSQRLVHLDTGDVWSQALDPQAIQWAGRFDAPGLPTSDATLGKAFQVFYTPPSNATIVSFDLATQVTIAAISYPEPGSGASVRVIRWGSDGLAYPTEAGITLVNGAFVSAPPKPAVPVPANHTTLSGQQLLILPRATNDLVWNPHDQRLYLAVSGSDSAYGNSIVSIDPQSGMVLSTHPVVSDPQRIVLSDDGQFLYVGLLGSGTIERVKLPDMTSDERIPLGWTSGPLTPRSIARIAMDLSVAPGLPHTVAAAIGTINEITPAQWGALTIFDDAMPRANSASNIVEHYDSVQWGADSSALFAADGETSLSALYSFSVDPAGVSNEIGHNFAFQGNFRRMHYDATTKMLYADNGTVVSATTGARIGNFNGARAVAVDAALQKAWTIPEQPFKATVADVTITSFDLNSFAQIASVTVPNVQGRVLQFTRWGSNGLAFCSDLGFVYILSGSLVN
jgi:hypothetical protein